MKVSFFFCYCLVAYPLKGEDNSRVSWYPSWLCWPWHYSSVHFWRTWKVTGLPFKKIPVTTKKMLGWSADCKKKIKKKIKRYSEYQVYKKNNRSRWSIFIKQICNFANLVWSSILLDRKFSPGTPCKQAIQIHICSLKNPKKSTFLLTISLFTQVLSDITLTVLSYISVKTCLIRSVAFKMEF